MKLFIKIITIAFIVVGVTSCSKSDPDPTTPYPYVTFLATLTGASEVPANPSTASGTATLTFNPSTKIMALTVNHNITTPTAGHIHKGATTVAGPVTFGFTSPASPINYTSVAIDAAQEADLFANLYYVNIHTALYPGGEIRGQLIKQ
jgi:CHRD domain